MGLGTCMLSLMVVILITGVQSADKQLGDACTADDACLDATLKLACDKLLKKCVLKVGETCNENGRKGLCVTGAACSGSTNTKCECGAGYTADATSGLCTATAQKYGGACGDSDACGTGLTCDTSLSLCKCETDKKPDLSDGTCVGIGNGELGKACDDSTKATACTDANNLVCPSGGGTCACKAGHIGVLGGACVAIGNEKIGQACTADDKGTTCGVKATTNLDCVQGVCTCGTNYTGVTGGLCIKKVGLLGGQCSTTCSDSTLTCVQNVCKRPLGGVCEQGTDCSDGNTMLCDEVTKTCLLKSGQDCKGNTDKCSSGAACTTDKCKCDTDLTTAETDKCTPKANKVGGSCTDGSCEDSNAQCTDSVCVCKTNFSVNKQSLTCSSKAGAVVASMTLMLVATLTGLFTRL